MARIYFDGYGLTELRRHARDEQIKGRSKMTGWELLTALRSRWTARRIAAEYAVLDAVVPGALLRHKSTGTILEVLGSPRPSDNPHHDGALVFEARYVEVSGNELSGAWKGRGTDYARYLNDEDDRRAANGLTTFHMVWQHEAVAADERKAV